MSRDITNALYAGLALATATTAAAPYLARLTLSVPERDNRRWWAGRPASVHRVWATALTAAGTGALAGLAAGTTALLPAYLALALTATPLAIIDVEHHRLPDRLVGAAAAAGGVALAAAAAATGHWAALGRSAAAAAATLGIGTLLTLAAPFGFGDTKLASVLAGYLGWYGWGYVLYGVVAGFGLAALATLPLLITGRAGPKTAIPLGPALIAGALLAGAARLTA